MPDNPEYPSPEQHPPLERPKVYADDRSDDELPKLSESDFQALTRMAPDLRNATTLEEFGMDFNNGIQPVLVEGVRMYVNTNEDDFGTIVRNPSRVTSSAEADLQPDLGEYAEVPNELPREVKEFISTFAAERDAAVSDAVVNVTQLNQLGSDIRTTISSLSYSDELKSDEHRNKVIGDEMEKVQDLFTHLNGIKDRQEQAYLGTKRFLEETEDLLDTMRRDESVSDELKYTVKKLEVSAVEIANQATLAHKASEDATEATATLHRFMDAMITDSWGYEAYIVQVSQQLDQIEESLARLHGALVGTEAELPLLRDLAA